MPTLLENYHERRDDPEWWNDQLARVDDWNEVYQQLETDSGGLITHEEAETSHSVAEGRGTENTDWTVDETPELQGNPTKKSLLTLCDQIEIPQAFAELIDNILQNYETNKAQLAALRDGDDSLKVKVIIEIDESKGPKKNQNGFIYIEENSGGVLTTNRTALIKPGLSGWSGSGVGIWGNGSKIALAKLGRHNVIKTSTFAEMEEDGALHPPVQITFGSSDGPNQGVGREFTGNYYEKNNDYWNLSLPEATSGKPSQERGWTTHDIRQLTGDALHGLRLEPKYRKMLEQMTKLYANKISKLADGDHEKISITFHNHRLSQFIPSMAAIRDVDIAKIILQGADEDEHAIKAPMNKKCDWNADKHLFSYIPGLEPREFDFVINCKPEGATTAIPLKMNVVVGLPLDNSKSNRGFDLWGNGRLFEEGFCNTAGVGTKYKQASWKSGSRDQGGRVKGFVNFECEESSLIPWKGPVKWGFNLTEDKTRNLIREILAKCICKFVRASHHISAATSDLIDENYFSTTEIYGRP